MNPRKFFPYIFSVIIFQGCKEKPVADITRYAANEDVASFMKNYEGRGVLTDWDSKPLAPEEALSGFVFPEDLELELVLSEPQIIQPVHMSFDHRGRLWVVQYHQYPYPEGLKITAIDNHTRVQFDKVPEAPPRGVRGADKITFFEDTDGDGSYDKSTEAISGLNIATAVALGRGKIWVLNPPYLLAYADPDGDGLPEGEPEVHLEGFGLEDTHAVANSLTWGPDGWLYGAQGSTTTANISSAVTKNVAFQGQAIWRYHPESSVFEIFAEGGGNNAFNVEIDSKGRIFSGSNGHGRGPYYKQGAYYIKSWGKHGPLTNPYAFGYLPNMPLEGEKKRFTHSLIKYEGAGLPENYHGKMFAVNPLHNYVQLTAFEEEGSSFKNIDGPVILETTDKWFRPVDIKLGPEGAVYMADWYDSRLSHVDPRDTWHKSSGRIYRLKGKGQPTALPDFDLSKYDSQQLTELLSHKNKWFRQQALRQFGDRRDPAALPGLMALFVKGNEQEALEALWAIHLTGGFSDEMAIKALDHPDPAVRMWGVRLLGDRQKVSPEISRHLVRLSSREPDPEVRGQLASSARRLPVADALPIIRSLLENHDDTKDPDIPLLIWWALESKAVSGRESVLALFEAAEMWSNPVVEDFVLHRLMQRYTMEGGEEGYSACTRLLQLAPSPQHAKILIAGLQEGLLGREIVELPKELLQALKPYGDLSGEAPLTLQLRQGEEKALAEALEIIANGQAPVGERLAYIQVMGETNQPQAVPVLLGLVQNGGSSPALKQAALHALQRYGDDEIGKKIAAAYPGFRDNIYVREAALSLFASRSSWAKNFLHEVEGPKTIHADDVPDHLVKRFRLLEDEDIDKTLDRLWPQLRPSSSAEKTVQINNYGKILSSRKGDPVNGKVLFLTNCGSCHRLYGEGSLVGPELTGYDRSNPEYLLLHTVDPDADIREGYEVQRIVTTDGRTLEGRIKSQDGGTLVLEPPLGGKTITLSKERILEIEVQQRSFMPERLLDSLSDQEIRDLFAYLMDGEVNG